jgi:small subunit ribosomal protein S20
LGFGIWDFQLYWLAMPIIKSAKKRMRQTVVRTERRLPYKTRMKTLTKKVMLLAKEGKKDEATKALPEACKALDMAVKRHILHWKTAARRKSSMSRAIKEKNE